MAEQLRYVNRSGSNSAGGNGTSNGTAGATRAYFTLAEWEANEQQDLVSAGDTARGLCDSGAGSADNATVDIAGWTTGVSDFITIEPNTDNEAVLTSWDTARYILSTNVASVAMIKISTAYVTVKGLQIHNLNASGIGFELASTNSLIDGVRIRATGAGNPIYGNTASSTATIQNFILFHFDGTTGGSEGIYISGTASGSTILAYNGCIYGFDDGAEDDGSALTCKNVASIANVAQDFDTVTTVDYCLSDDGTGTNAQTPAGASHTNEFVDPANEDFTAVATGNIQNGIGPSSDANVPTLDMEGDTRSGSTAFIGADEPAASGISIPVVMNQLRNQGVA